MTCNHWSQNCHLGNPKHWKRCAERLDVECDELAFGWTHYPDSPWGDIDICVHGVTRTHGTTDVKCRWCG